MEFNELLNEELIASQTSEDNKHKLKQVAEKNGVVVENTDTPSSVLDKLLLSGGIMQKFETETISNVVYADKVATISGTAKIDNETGIPFTIKIPLENSDGGLIIDANNTNNGIDIRFASEVNLNARVPESAMNGTLTDEELALLQSSDNNKIIFNNEIYYLSSRGHEAGSLIYSCIERENNQTIIKAIAITINTKGWELFKTVSEKGADGLTASYDPSSKMLTLTGNASFDEPTGVLSINGGVQ